MKYIKGVLSAAAIMLLVSPTFAQETDDMYFRKEDRKEKKNIDHNKGEVSQKMENIDSLDINMNPDYLDRMSQNQVADAEYFNEDYKEDAASEMASSYKDETDRVVVNNYYGNGYGTSVWDNPYVWGGAFSPAFGFYPSYRTRVIAYDPFFNVYRPYRAYRTGVRVTVRSGWYGYSTWHDPFYDPFYDPWCPMPYSSTVVSRGWGYSGWGYNNWAYNSYSPYRNTTVINRNTYVFNGDNYSDNYQRGRRDIRGGRVAGISTQGSDPGSNVGRRPTGGRVDTDNTVIRTRRSAGDDSKGATTGRIASANNNDSRSINTRRYTVSDKFNNRTVSTYKNDSESGKLTSRSVSTRDYFSGRTSSPSERRATPTRVNNNSTDRSDYSRSGRSTSNSGTRVNYTPRTQSKSYHKTTPVSRSKVIRSERPTRSYSNSGNSRSSSSYTPTRSSSNNRSGYTPTRSSSSPAIRSSGSSGSRSSGKSTPSRRGN